MLETMKAEVERSSSNISTARETTKNLQGTTENYEKLSGTLDESRGLIRDLWKKNRNDMIYIMGALGVFIATAMWVVLQRTPGVVWLPGKLILRQLGNLIPKSDSAVKFVERVVEMTESALSDNEDVPEMFVDSIGRKEEYGSDDLLKQEPQEPSDEQVSEERSEPESSSEAAMKKIVPEPINEPQVTQEQVKIPKSVDKQEASTPVMAEPVQAEIMSTETPAEQIIPETTEPVQEKVHIKQVVADIKDKTADISPSVEVQAPIVEIKKRTDEAESISSEAAVTVKEHFVKEIAETNKSETDHVKSESAVSQPVIQPVKEDIVTSVKEVIEPTTVVITESTANEVPAITQVPNTEEKSVNGVQEAIKPMADVAAESVLSEVTSNTQTPDIAEKLVATVSDVATTTQVPEIVGTTDSVPTETLAHIAKATENVPIHEITPTAAPTISHKITTESTYYTATESGFEGNQSNYSSEAELFSTSDEKVEL